MISRWLRGLFKLGRKPARPASNHPGRLYLHDWRRDHRPEVTLAMVRAWRKARLAAVASLAP